MKRLAINLVKIAVACALIAWLVTSGRLDLGLLVRVPLSTSYLLGLATLLVATLLIAVRWWWLLLSQDIRLTLGQTVRLAWIGQFFSVVLPGATGGEVVRAYYIRKAKPEATIAGFSTVLVDRVLGLYALLWLGLGSLAALTARAGRLEPGARQLGLVSILFTAAISGLLWGLWWRPTRDWLLRWMPGRFRANVASTLEAYSAQPGVILASIALSLVANALYVLSFALASEALGSSVPLAVFFLVIPLVTMANSVPLSPGGIGVAEATSSLLFAQFGVPTGAPLMLLVRLWLALLRLPGALFYITRPR